MDISYASSFDIIDYFLFVSMLLCLFGIGGFANYRGNKSAEDFLLGNRTFGSITIGLSLVASAISSIGIIGFMGEVYAYGLQIIWFILGSCLAIWTIAVVILPVFCPLDLRSVNEYLQLRFESTALYKTASVILSISEILFTGAVLFSPTVVLAAAIPLSLEAHILILGAVVTLYSSTGGVRGVIWTQIFQLGIAIIGTLLIVVLGLYDVGPSKVWNTARDAGRLEIFNFSLDLTVRHTVWNTTCLGFFLTLSKLGCSQVSIQRLGSITTKKGQTKKALLVSVFGMNIFNLLIFTTGVIAYVGYAGCDPWKLGILKKKEEITLYFIFDRLGFVPGLPGIFVATVTAGTFSVFSGALNGIVAMLWKDFLSQTAILRDVKPTTAEIINRIISLLVGGIITMAAILSVNATNLVEFALRLVSALVGPIVGVYMLGLLFPKTTVKGACAGLFISLVLTTWIGIGGFLYLETPPPLPLSIEQCPSPTFNASGLNLGKAAYEVILINSTSDKIEIENEFPLMNLYRISYTVHGLLASIICVIIGIAVSHTTGGRDVKDLEPKYISPFVRKFYWDEEFLKKSEKLDKMKQNLKIHTDEKCKEMSINIQLSDYKNISN